MNRALGIEEAFSSLGGVEDVLAKARAGYGPLVRPGHNAHVHLPPNFSAFRSIEQAVRLAEQQGVRVLCASNYYDFGVYESFLAEARRRGVFPLFGTEIITRIDELAEAGRRINDPGNPGKMYLCGKGITRLSPLSARAAEILAEIRRNDETRMAEMVSKLAALFAQRGVETGLTERVVREGIVRRHGCPIEAVVLQERHVAQAFQEALFEKVSLAGRAEAISRVLGAEYAGDVEDDVKMQGEIRTHLIKAGKAAFVAERFVTYAEARELILQLGGIPCYPTLADGAKVPCEYEQPVEALIDHLHGLDVHCAEFIPIRNNPETLTEYVTKMRSAGMVISGGTEHNTLDLLPIEPTCLAGQAVPEPVKDIFWEGACVMAAHQFLALQGRCGYVDADGELNPDYNDAETRIASLARLGEAVIQSYFDAGKIS